MSSRSSTLACIAALGALIATGCDSARSPRTVVPPVAEVADVIYVGGDIVTVNDRQPTVEALAVRDGRSSRLVPVPTLRRRTKDRQLASSTSPARRCCQASSMATATSSIPCWSQGRRTCSWHLLARATMCPASSRR
jgi:hypothetical protein